MKQAFLGSVIYEARCNSISFKTLDVFNINYFEYKKRHRNRCKEQDFDNGENKL